jgi:hypothetical protein
LRHPALHDGSGVVPGAVIDDENFGVPATLGDAGQHAVQRMLDAGALVERGNNDTQLWMCHNDRRPLLSKKTLNQRISVRCLGKGVAFIILQYLTWSDPH